MEISINVDKNVKNNTGFFEKYLLSILLFSSFGPYVFPSIGIRLEHIVIYISFIIVFFMFIYDKKTLRINLFSLTVMAMFFLIAMISILVNIFSNYQYISLINVIAGIENYTQPIVLILVIILILSYKNSKELHNDFNIFLNLLCILLAINTLFSLLMFYFGPNDIIRLFAGTGRGDAQGLSVAERALSAGRGAGVFNQPIEGGVAYSIGLMSWAYLVKNKSAYVDKLKNNIIFFVMLVGGILVGSKVFLVGGSIIFILYFNPIKNWKIVSDKKFYISGVVILFSFFFLANHWTGAIPISRGFVYTTRLFDIHLPEKTSSESDNKINLLETEKQIVSIYTSGRFGRESGIISEFKYMLEHSPLYGFGFGVYQTSDNAFLEVVRQSGMIGILLYTSIFLIFFLFCFIQRTDEAKFLFLFWILLLVSSIGAPIVTANRISVYIWIISTFLLMFNNREKLYYCIKFSFKK